MKISAKYFGLAFGPGNMGQNGPKTRSVNMSQNCPKTTCFEGLNSSLAQVVEEIWRW